MSNDNRPRRAVLSELEWEPGVTAAVERLAWDLPVPSNQVRVTVEHGWVTLSGEVGR